MPMDQKEHQPDVVLVVDDEPLVRLDTMHMLYRAGFEVCEAASAHEAMAVLDERSDVTVLVTDVQMPGRNGVDLAKHVRETHPSIAVLLLSGHTRPDDMPGDVEFMSKPCRMDLLVSRVRAAAKKR
jgi:two-component system, response regulator PdtaR